MSATTYARGIDAVEMTPGEFRALLADPFVADRVADLALVVIRNVSGDELPAPGALPLVVCVVGDELGGAGPVAADVVVDSDSLELLRDNVVRCPVAATTLAVILRITGDVSVEQGLALESAAYSTLQAGAEFARWRGDTVAAALEPDADTVRIDRNDDELTITLDRPHRHNAITARLRDDLCDALAVALADDSITSVVLRGAGGSFCSGGDLAEFGARPDPAVGHVVRLVRSPARLLHRLADRTTVRVHGSTLGGGIELAAFARRVIADPAARMGLPEVGLGLLPGAGGTVSLPRRIGRQRTAALALTMRHVDAPTALAWGLIDEIEPLSPVSPGPDDQRAPLADRARPDRGA